MHTPYIINLASAEKRIEESSVRLIKEDLTRASTLGARYVMTHVGSAKDGDKGEALYKIAENLKKSLTARIPQSFLLRCRQAREESSATHLRTSPFYA